MDKSTPTGSLPATLSERQLRHLRGLAHALKPVAAGERRDFRRLLRGDPPRRFRRTSASLPPAKGVTFAGYSVATLRGDFGGHQLRWLPYATRTATIS
jgi:hypothetical protein